MFHALRLIIPSQCSSVYAHHTSYHVFPLIKTTLQPQQPVPADHVSSIAAAADALNAILQQSLPANEVESSPPVDENEATSQTSSSSTAQEQSGTDRREHFPCSECSRVFRRKFDRDRK